MRGYDEDDDEDLFEEHDGEQEQEQDPEQEQENGDDNENEDEEDETMGGDDDDDGGDHSDEDGSDDDEDEEDQDEDDDGDGDNDEDDDEDDDEDEDDEDGEDDGGDIEMGERKDGVATGPTSPKAADVPPHLLRRRGFVPSYPPDFTTLSLDAVVGISSPSAVHSLATSLCSSYLLTGSQDGHVRAYDLWSSVNGNQLMTAQQRSVVGLGESVNKAGVSRGWWNNEVEQGEGEDAWRGLEPVYSLACESDGLWAAAGTRSGPINLFTLRHSPGHLVHALKGHNNVVSCLSLLPDERHLLSGSWDGTVRDWDLNTGQSIRTYPTHGAQISSLALRPTGHLAAELHPSVTNGVHVSVNAGPDFFAKDRTPAPTTNGHGSPAQPAVAQDADGTEAKVEPPSSPAAPTEPANGTAAADTDATLAPPDGDILMDAPSPFDPLFDDMGGDADAEGESVLPSNDATADPTPAQTPRPVSNGFGLALPGSNSTTTKPLNDDTKPATASAPLFSHSNAQAGPSRSGAGAAGSIPLLTHTTYDAFSEDIMMTSSMDGQVTLIDRRVPSGSEGGVGRLQAGERAPPWCMSACWSGDGNQILAGRRNGTIDIWDVRRSSSSTAPNLLRTLKTPPESGFISCVVGFIDGRHVATASQDNIRLWNTVEYFEPEDSMKKSKSRPPFKIIAGHHGGTISSMVVDPTNRFLITASGDRGWQGEATKVVLIHDIKAS